jgi:signal transduction histidine kinase
MYTVGIWLIYASVVLRAYVAYAGRPQVGLVLAWLALYGLLLLLAPGILGQPSLHPAWPARTGPEPDRPPSRTLMRPWLPALYLLVQAGVVMALFFVPPHLDHFAGLFIPLSLQAVLFLGRRLGFLCIALFPLAMFGALASSARGWPFALAMACLAGAVCFLFGSYAHQVQETARARVKNQRLLAELQVANHRLQGAAAQAEDLAAEQERNRLARELHDSVTQTVFSMNLTVQSARLLLDRDPTRAAGQLWRLEELAASAMGEIQALVSQLRPMSVAEDGLLPALRRLAFERQARDGLQVSLDAGAEMALPEAVATGLYRIVQEALVNVVKHAGTCQATVRLNLGGNPASLEIIDHGLGFDPQAALGQRGHLGLAGMAEQAREMGWNLAVDSRPGRGTRIRVEGNLAGGPG